MDSSHAAGGESGGAGRGRADSSSESGSPLLRSSLPVISVIPPRAPRKPGMPKLTIPSRPGSSASATSIVPGAGSYAGPSSQPFHPSQAASGPGPSKLSQSIVASTVPSLSSTTTAATTCSSSSSSGSGGGAGGPPSLSIRTSSSGGGSGGSAWGVGGGSGAAAGPSFNDEEGYEGFVGSGPDAYAPPPQGAGGLHAASGFATTTTGGSTSKGTIYPDTIPHLGLGEGNAADAAALTNDLRRAIGNLSIASSSAGVEGDVKGGAAVAAAEMARRASAEGTSGQAHHVGVATSSATPGVIPGLSSSSSSSTGGGAATNPNNGQVHHDEHEDQDMVLKGNLEIIGRLGEGASGEVMKALHKPTGLVMAIKSISTSPNPAIHRQILRELSFNRTCHSDYIVRYYGAFLSDAESSIVVICMENCEGGSLDGIYKMVKKRNGRTGEKVLGKVAEAGLKGLEYLRERKIIHRDIKPSNILLTRDGGIKLCDFGVSGELINSVAGTFTGTGYYMAPERIQGLPYNISSDVWSLGLSILEVASNRFPFPPEGEPPLGPIDLLSYIITMRTPELQDDERGGVKWGKAFRDFLERCLEKDPSKRPGPKKMLSHPFVRKSEARVSQSDIARFVAEVWGWTEHVAAASNEGGEAASSVPSAAAAANAATVEALSRIPSLRRAPPTPSSASSSSCSPLAAAGGGLQSLGASGGPKSSLPRLSSLTPVQTGLPGGPAAAATGVQDQDEAALEMMAGQDALAAELHLRSAQERAAARMREADAGLIGSPTSE